MKILMLALLLNYDVCNNSYKHIVEIVEKAGWKVTSTTGGRHNRNSKHYEGKAVDVSVRMKNDLDVIFLTETLEKEGYIVKDERIRPPMQRVWGGPHLHISIPPCLLDIQAEPKNQDKEKGAKAP